MAAIQTAREEEYGELYWFEPSWFKKFGIRGFWISLKDGKRNFDESLIAHLRENLKKDGYDISQKIELSTSDDKELQGHATDGTHRLVALDDNLKEGIPLPNPFPITYYNVTSYADVLTRIIEHDEEYLHNVHKSPRVAKEKMELKVAELDEFLSRTLPMLPLEEYIDKSELSDDAKDQILKIKQKLDRENKLKLQSSDRIKPSRKPADAEDEWGAVAITKPINLDPEKFAGTSTITPMCPACHEQFNVHIRLGTDGKLEFFVPKGQVKAA